MRLTVTKAGTGTGLVFGDVGVDNEADDIVCGPSCFSDAPRGVAFGLNAVPDPGSTFGGFSANCAPSPTFDCAGTLDKDETVVATFTATAGNFANINVVVNGVGTVRATWLEIANGPETNILTCTGILASKTTSCTGQFPLGVSVKVQVVGNDVSGVGRAFTSWGGACAAQSPSPTCFLAGNGDISVIANFTP